ncbi:MAG TPA: mercuric reductase [Herpetosiphonaceae bacterium]|nr:mercuric reductase [Herpetosiphonaceae bacterium]
MAEQVYDVVIIGGGQAGIPLAGSLAQAGRQVVVVERKHLGGSCVNFGCTPTKAVVASAKVAHQARRAAEYGLRVPSVDVDFAAVLERARRISQNSRTGLDRRFEGSNNPRLVRGHARLAGRDGDLFRVEAGDEVLKTRQVVLNTGTRSSIPPIDGLAEVDYLDSENWLDRPELPEHVVMIGGGYVALEMGQIYRRLGSDVTILERGERVASHEDEDVAAVIQNVLESEGVGFALNTGIRSVRKDGSGITVTVDSGSGAHEIRASHLFVATGRRPNTDDLGLETVGVETTDHGLVGVDERLATSVAGIWCAGDIRGGPMFTHTSWDDYRVLESQMIGDGSRTTKRIIPYAIFTDPEVGRVGMTEREARQAHADVKVARVEMRDSSKAIERGETEGFIKVIVDAPTDRLLGATVLAADGSELVHLYIDLMNADAPYSVMRDAIHIHPTLAEHLQTAVTRIG